MKKPRHVSFLSLLTIALVLGPLEAAAFKLETHLWVAQQVLNDLLEDEDGDGEPDGTLTIEPFGDFAVRPDVVDALRSHRDEYRMGNIGPDGFPDLAGGQLTTHPGVPGGWPTDRWLSHVLTSAETARQQAFAYGYLSHAAGDVFAHTYVNTYTGDLFGLFDEQENEIRHILLEEYIKNRTPPIRDLQGNSLEPHAIVDAPASFLRDTVVLDAGVAEQYRKQPQTLYLASMHALWSAQGEAIQGLEEGILSDEIEAIEEEIDALSGALRGKIDELAEAEVCLFDFCLGITLLPGVCEAEELADELVGPVKDGLPFFLDDAVDLFVDAMVGSVDPVCGTITATETALEAARRSLQVHRELEQLALATVREPIRAWRGEVEQAIRAYMLASEQVVVEIMKEDGEPPQEILTDWLCEWAPTFAAIPNELPGSACEASDALSEFRESVDEIRAELGDPILELRQSLTETLRERGVDLVDDLTGDDGVLSSLVDLRTREVDADALNDEFAHDDSDKGLLLIPDVAERVDAEMAVTFAGTFDPEAYNVAYDAVVLAKLVLLGPAELNRMVEEAGVTGGTIYGPQLFGSFPTNILFRAVRSIDGNHQWQHFGLPSPRREGHGDQKSASERAYGYRANRVMGRAFGGFRLWQDCEVREKVFTRIFHGPLARGVVAPSLLGMPDVLEDDESQPDPNRASLEDPFPLAEESSDLFKLTGAEIHRYARGVDELVVGLEPRSCGTPSRRIDGFYWRFAPRGVAEREDAQRSHLCDPRAETTRLVVPSDARLRLEVRALEDRGIIGSQTVTRASHRVHVAGPPSTVVQDWTEVDDFYRRTTGVGACDVGPTACALVDNGDGTITDTCAGLMWLEDANHLHSSAPSEPHGKLPFAPARAWAANLDFAGYDDWRLPRADPTCEGFGCTSELGHLFYVALGNRAADPPAHHGPFENVDLRTVHPIDGRLIRHDRYWELRLLGGRAFGATFDFRIGELASGALQASPWAVRSVAPGDLDGDGGVDADDFTAFLSTYTRCAGDEGFVAEADYDQDGCVTLVDYQTWYGYFLGS